MMMTLRGKLLSAMALTAPIAGISGCGERVPKQGAAASAAPASNLPPLDAPSSMPRTSASAPVCSPGVPGCSCFAPRTKMRSDDMDPPEKEKLKFSHSYDQNGCAPALEVTSGCCNPATEGPFFTDGQCCYVTPGRACCGRPFLVEGRAWVAGVVPRSDWLGSFAPDPSRIDSIQLEVAAAWLADAQLEHASAASFARFVMDLVAVGAPADLIRCAGLAIADEVRHAEQCFALASRFGMGTLGPAPMPQAGTALDARDPMQIVERAVSEGCIGETLATVFARAQLERAADPHVRAALEVIVRDEENHAALACRFIAWSVRALPGARGAALRAYAEARGSLPIPGARPTTVCAATWGALGRLESREAEGLAARTARDVLDPLFAALVAG